MYRLIVHAFVGFHNTFGHGQVGMHDAVKSIRASKPVRWFRLDVWSIGEFNVFPCCSMSNLLTPSNSSLKSE